MDRGPIGLGAAAAIALLGAPVKRRCGEPL
jgi:hypothetical protein